MFDAIGKTKEAKKDVEVDARFSMKCSTHDSLEKYFYKIQSYESNNQCRKSS